MTIALGIHGAAGRMGRRLIALAADDPELEIGAAVEHSGHPDLGKDAGAIAGVAQTGVVLADRFQERVDAIIDFSSAVSVLPLLSHCADARIPLVLATTGLPVEAEQRVREAAEKLPIVWAPNMSLAVNLTMKLATLAAAALKNHPGGADVEIIERHHHFKEDAPSGTALRFGQLIAAAMGQTEHRHGRSGLIGPRPGNEIGYHALRVGDNPGEHTIVFGLLGETIELTVRATNRDCYAAGALAAAKFVVDRPPGVYGMEDVLGD